MARDAVSLIRALGLTKVDLGGFSLGGFVSQVIALDEPQLVRKIVLAGTGPGGGVGIDKVTSVTFKDMGHAALTFSDPKRYLLFGRRRLRPRRLPAPHPLGTRQGRCEPCGAHVRRPPMADGGQAQYIDYLVPDTTNTAQ